jgi:hypothetical protein
VRLILDGSFYSCKNSRKSVKIPLSVFFVTLPWCCQVTDTAGNSRTDEVTVYVKPPSNSPPTAVAGEDQSHSLPLSYITLDGSGSRDDLNLTTVHWDMVSGPRPVVIAEPGGLVTNVTGLTVGTFVFQLDVWDAHGNNASDTVRVTIKQDSNQAPVARIVILSSEVVLPVNSLVLDGSTSSDDLAVERWVQSPLLFGFRESTTVVSYRYLPVFALCQYR